MWDIKNKFAINFKIIGMLTILEKGGSYEKQLFILYFNIFLYF